MTAEFAFDKQSLKAATCIVEEKDGWALRTMDRTIAAQFEHTIIVTQNEPIILTI